MKSKHSPDYCLPKLYMHGYSFANQLCRKAVWDMTTRKQSAMFMDTQEDT